MYQAISVVYGTGKESIFRTRDSVVTVHGTPVTLSHIKVLRNSRISVNNAAAL